MLSISSLLSTKRKRSSSPRRFVPRLEWLEDRSLPATTFTVVNLHDDGEGSLRQAVFAANINPGPDAIDFADGLLGTIPLTTGELGITDALTIDGPGADLLTVSGSNESRIFSISGGVTVAIAGLTIADGKAVGAPALGGGILNSGGILALDHVVLSNNQAVGNPSAMARGGAVANVSGAILTVTSCLFTENQALGGANGPGPNSSGGGIFNMASRLTVSQSAFLANQVQGGIGGGNAVGGGIDNSDRAIATVTDTIFSGNQAIAGDGGSGNGFGRGGGLNNFRSVLTVENCMIEGNLARGGSNITARGPRVGFSAGGGIFSADAATLILSGSTLKGNQAIAGSHNTSLGGNGYVGHAQGGGLNNVGKATVIDCLFEDNEARGGNSNQGDGASHQFVGTATGGGIGVTAGDPTGLEVSLTLQNVTLRYNRALGGENNTAGTFVNAGIGGGLGSNSSNNNLPVSLGSTTTLWDCTVAHNQAMGGSGGDALGGGVANLLGGVITISSSTLDHNRAQGGDGGAAGDGGRGRGGGIYNGAASDHPSNLGVPTVLMVEGSTITHNQAQGGAGTDGSNAGDGLGAGLWNAGTACVVDTAISRNHALGGAGAGGSPGGNGFGGGVYNAAASPLQLLKLYDCIVSENHANGGEGGEGGGDGEGIGGGVYNLGPFVFDVLTVILENHASTSHDDL